jgi:hypothetical protein
MGMFDYINYGGNEYQTKDTPAQALDTYEIRNNELWHKKVELRWNKDDDHMFGGHFEEISHEWVFCKDFDGVIRFYREDKENGGYKKNKWIDYKVLFMNGRIIKFERIGMDEE